MGNREDLLAGAKRCLYEKGYARTTARDIASAAGTSLAAIGYHFRTKEALLNEAVIDAMREWGEAVEQAVAGDAGAGLAPQDRFATAWERVIESFATHRQLWVTQLDLVSQIDHLPQLREQLLTSQAEARLGLAWLFGQAPADAAGAGAAPGDDGGAVPGAGEGSGGPDPAAPDGGTGLLVGGFLQVLLGGMLLQHLVSPQNLPSGRDLAEAVRIVAANFGSPPR